MKKTFKKEKYDLNETPKKDDFYSVLYVNNSSSKKDILESYHRCIKPFFNVPVLDNNDIEKIKLLKISLYVLSNPKLKNIYDNSINGPQALEDDNFVSVDHQETTNIDNESDILSKRIFEFPGKTPQLNNNMARGSIQCRDNNKMNDIIE
jgi:DnaJ-class molecular chaperone